MFILTTMDGAKIKISKKQEEYLTKVPSNKLVNLGASTINTSTIATIVPIEEYYRQHPDERPQADVVNYSQLPSPRNKINKQSALINLTKGLKKFCGEYKGSKKAEKLLENMTYKLNNCKDKDSKDYAIVDLMMG